jgi:hypothetical protein
MCGVAPVYVNYIFAFYDVLSLHLNKFFFLLPDNVIGIFYFTEIPLDAGCEEEIEIRGCSIFIVECMVKELKKLSQDEIPELKDLIFNSVMIDHFLWDYRRAHANALACIPFHHTTGIYY